VGTNSLLQNLVATGTYYVVALDQFSDETGSYSLSVARFGGSQNVSSGDQGGALASGDYHTGSIVPGDFDVYTVSASAGNALVASLGEVETGGAAEPHMMIFSPTGLLLANVSTAGVANWVLPNLATTGTYAVVALDLNGDEAFDYGLTAARVGPGVTQTVAGGDQGGALNSGERRAGRIEAGDIDAFTFNLSAGNGALWTVGETIENAFNPWLIVLGPNGNVLVNVSNARGRDFALPAGGAATAGTYTALILDDGGGIPGEYALTGVAVPATQAADDDHGTLTIGQARAGALPPGDADVYTFTATAGQALTFSLARTGTGALNPGLLVYGPTGNLVGSNVGTTSAQVAVPSAVAGTYTVVVEESGGDGSGAYSIALNTTVGPDTFGPRLLESAYRYNDPKPIIRLAFSEDVSASFDPGTFVLKNLTTNQNVAAADLAITFTTVTHEIIVGLSPLPGGVLPDGNYRLTIPGLIDEAANPLAGGTLTLDFFVFAGDANRDRVVDFNDLVVLAQNYNTSGGKRFINGDFSYDGNVDFNDLVLLAQRYNTTLAPPAPAPPVAAAFSGVRIAAPTRTARSSDDSLFSVTSVRPVAAVKPRPVARRALGTRR
jgi:hypothetical protein